MDKEKLIKWIKEKIFLKIIADFIVRGVIITLTLILSFFGLKKILSINSFSTIEYNIIIICLIIILLIYIILKNRNVVFLSEKSANLFLIQKLAFAKKNIIIFGHAGSVVFKIKKYLNFLLSKGINISVFLFDPESEIGKNKKVNLDEQNLYYLINKIKDEDKNRDDQELFYSLADSSEIERKSIIPIILSLVYGWYPMLYEYENKDKDSYGDLCISLYDFEDSFFKAIIIDDNIAFVGNYNFPIEVTLTNKIHLLKKTNDIEKIIEFIKTIQSCGKTRKLNYQIRTGFRNYLFNNSWNRK